MIRKKDITQPIPELPIDRAVNKIMKMSVGEWERLKLALEKGRKLKFHAIKQNLHVVLSELGFTDINTEVTENVDVFFRNF